MRVLTKLYMHRLIRQKFVSVFFLCLFAASYSYAFLISTPEMESMLNVNMEQVGKGNFPEFMIRFYVGTVGILFVTFLITFYICEEDKRGILFQPLLHGESRSGILKSKLSVIGSMSFFFVLFTGFLHYVTAFMRWGRAVLETGILLRVVIKYLFSGVYMACLAIGIVAICIWTRSTLKTVSAVIFYLFIDAFICGMDSALLKNLWIGYYPNLSLFSYEYREIPWNTIFWGSIVIAVYGILFYRIAMERVGKIDV
ncbi:MAG: ABC transporter permease subunit [Lachnospiraceae bacterium]|nr:ABC transporter permease subunit [Lachnospiraceae bacterium]